MQFSRDYLQDSYCMVATTCEGNSESVDPAKTRSRNMRIRFRCSSQLNNTNDRSQWRLGRNSYVNSFLLAKLRSDQCIWQLNLPPPSCDACRKSVDIRLQIGADILRMWCSSCCRRIGTGVVDLEGTRNALLGGAAADTQPIHGDFAFMRIAGAAVQGSNSGCV